jgi:hypothetical protein
MDFITPEQYQQLLDNDQNGQQDPAPVVMLHIPNTSSVWLLTSAFTANPDIAYGLIIAKGQPPKMGCVSLYDLFMNNEPAEAVKPEPAFVPQFPVSFYQAHAEQRNGTLDRNLLTTPLPY